MKINFLWIGDRLGKLEQLTLKSYLDNNHTPVIWLYDLTCSNIPEGVVKEDANQILPSNKIFSYTGRGDCRKGSYGGFSDIFRYYLLLQTGGWYSDMDVTCLKNFSDVDNQPYVFRPHRYTKAVGNIMKCPAQSTFLQKCIDKTEAIIDMNNDKWVYPVQILSDCIFEDKLDKFIAPKAWFGEDNINDLKDLLNIGVFSNRSNLPTYAVHWCNEALSTGQWDWTVKRDFNTPIPTTLYYNLLKKHNLL
jgi:hypothetical protein